MRRDPRHAGHVRVAPGAGLSDAAGVALQLSFRRRPGTVPPPLPESAPRADLRYALHPAGFTAGNQLRVLRDGTETYPAMLEAIRAAERTVHLETYILAADRTGRRFGELLAEKARAGVTVRLLFDSVGALGLPASYVDELVAAGVKVCEFHPVWPWRRRFHLSQRDHRKILVVDGRWGFVGGLNIADNYAPVSEGGVGWHDMHCRLEGPAVGELQRLFRRTWTKAGGDHFPLDATTLPPPCDDDQAASGALVRVIGNEGVRGRSPIRRVYLHALKQARRTIAIANAYFIPDRGLRRALLNAAQRGVQVRVIVPGRSDVAAVRWATRHLYRLLLRGGVRIYEWRGRMMHAKTAVIDEVWSTVGSCNLDAMSLQINLEVIAIAIDRAFGRRMAEQFVIDVAESREIELAEWAKRPWWHRPIEWFFFQLRAFL
jgi:cardiolipin synthase